MIMKKEIKKEQCVCEKLKERVRRFPKEYTTLGEEVKDWTCINFGLDEVIGYASRLKSQLNESNYERKTLCIAIGGEDAQRERV